MPWILTKASRHARSLSEWVVHFQNILSITLASAHKLSNLNTKFELLAFVLSKYFHLFRMEIIYSEKNSTMFIKRCINLSSSNTLLQSWYLQTTKMVNYKHRFLWPCSHEIQLITWVAPWSQQDYWGSKVTVNHSNRTRNLNIWQLNYNDGTINISYTNRGILYVLCNSKLQKKEVTDSWAHEPLLCSTADWPRPLCRWLGDFCSSFSQFA